MIIIIGLSAAAAAFSGVALLTWIGICNGDQPSDLRMHARLEAHRHQTDSAAVHVTLVNPSDRPVITATRTRKAPAASFRLHDPLSVHTSRTSPTILSPDAVIEAIPAMTTKEMILNVELARNPKVRIETVAFEHPGRVRHITRLLAPPRATASLRRHPDQRD